jgi:plastocyanin
VNPSIRRALSVLAMILLLAGTLAACGTSSKEAEPTVTRESVAGAPPTRTPTVPGQETPATGGAASPAPSTGGGQAAGGQATTVEVDMVDLAFKPTELTIPANTDVTIHAVNSGALPHTFTIPDVADTGELAAGETKDITVNLPPGTYDFHCAIPGHEAAGMVGKLIVK